MNTFLNYLGHVSLVWLLFYLVYVLLLRHETFFAWNRRYLLLSMFVALLLPLAPTLPTTQAIPVGEVVLLLDDEQETTSIEAPQKIKKADKVPLNQATNPTNEEEQVTFFKGIVLIYWIGFVVSLGYFLRNIAAIYTLIRKFGIVRLPNTFTFQVHTDETTPIFTFLNILFWHESTQWTAEQRTKILIHELTHIRQGHGIDLLFAELLQLVFWFNPVAYFYKKSLQTTHEYLADKAAIDTKQAYMPKNDYAKLLVNQVFETNVFPLTHSFFTPSLLKQRITMLTKTKSRKIASLKFVVAIPIVLLCVFLFACEKEFEVLQAPEVEKSKETLYKYASEDKKTAIQTVIFNGENKATFTVPPNHYTTIKLAVIDGNYDNVALRIVEDGKELFVHRYDEMKNLSGVILLGIDTASSRTLHAEVLFSGTTQKDAVLLVHNEKHIPKAPEPNVAGFLLLNASKSEETKEIAMSLRNDFEYTFTVTQGKAHIEFVEASTNQTYKAAKKKGLVLAPQKDIGGYLFIEPQQNEDVTVRMDYVPRN